PWAPRQRSEGLAQTSAIDRKRKSPVDLCLCLQDRRAHRGLAARAGTDSHEADVPAEQSQAQADPRLPGSDAHQGRAAGPQAATPEGAAADRGRSGGEASARARLRPAERLTRGAEFRRAFRQGVRLDGPLFVLVAAANGRSYSRLGLAASRKVGG